MLHSHFTIPDQDKECHYCGDGFLQSLCHSVGQKTGSGSAKIILNLNRHYIYYIPHVQIIVVVHFFLVAPPEAPISLKIDDVNSTSISITWEAVTCVYCTGGIIGHVVRHWDQEKDSVVTVSRTHTVNQHTLHGLTPSTKYSIEVAAVYNNVEGAFSSPITAETTSKISKT